MTQYPTVYLGLGGNEGDVLARLRQGLLLLSNHPAIFNLKYSHFYHTAPVEVDTPYWFVNIVSSFQTNLTPHELFLFTQDIENQLGKIPKPKNSPRPIDIDLLFYGDLVYRDDQLEIPHPRWHERLFVLIPLSDLTEEITLQINGKIQSFILSDHINKILLSQPDQSIYLLTKNTDIQYNGQMDKKE